MKIKLFSINIDRHAFMPIVVEAVDSEKYLTWIDNLAQDV